MHEEEEKNQSYRNENMKESMIMPFNDFAILPIPQLQRNSLSALFPKS